MASTHSTWARKLWLSLKGLHRLRFRTVWIHWVSRFLRRLSSRGYLSPQPVWRKVFPLWNEFKAQRELGAWLTIKLGKTRLKWQLACGEEPSFLSRSGIRPLNGTAVDKTEQNLVSTAFILQRINSNNSGRTRRNNRRCNRNISSKQLTYIWFFYNHWRQKSTIEI